MKIVLYHCTVLTTPEAVANSGLPEELHLVDLACQIASHQTGIPRLWVADVDVTTAHPSQRNDRRGAFCRVRFEVPDEPASAP